MKQLLLVSQKMSCLAEKNIYKEVIETPEFERLKHISFLGILDYLPKLKNSTRYDHSISVAELCHIYAKRQALTAAEETYTVLAGLLHDIGHSPFSHTMEKVFKRRFSVTHHNVSKKIILKSENLNRIWEKFYIDPKKIISTIESITDHHKLPFNLDALDGLMRIECNFTNSYTFKIISKLFDQICQFENTMDLEIFDLFWQHKQKIYKTYIYNDYFRIIEGVFQGIFMNDPDLNQDDFLLTDIEIQNKFKWTKEFIKNLNSIECYKNMTFTLDILDMPSKINSSTRNFYININEKFSAVDNKRYLVSIEDMDYDLTDELPIF